MDYLAYILFRIFIALFALIPFKVLYLISDLLRFFLKNIFKYRLDVIQKNVAHCFGSHKSLEEQKLIIDEFYIYFVDIILESFKGISIKTENLVSRFRILNPEIINNEFHAHQHIIFYSQHLNNWEWGITFGLQLKHHMVVTAKLLSNKYISDFMLAGRSKTNLSVIASVKTHQFFKNLDKQASPQAIVFIADQKPHGKEKKVMLPFFGHPTPFHAGAAHYASQSDFPIYTLDVYRKGRGRYEVKCHQLSPGKENINPEEITRRYVEHLEQLIKNAPSNWLWSHKRFKHIIDY